MLITLQQALQLHEASCPQSPKDKSLSIVGIPVDAVKEILGGNWEQLIKELPSPLMVAKSAATPGRPAMLFVDQKNFEKLRATSFEGHLLNLVQYRLGAGQRGFDKLRSLAKIEVRAEAETWDVEAENTSQAKNLVHCKIRPLLDMFGINWFEQFDQEGIPYTIVETEGEVRAEFSAKALLDRIEPLISPSSSNKKLPHSL